MTQTAAYIIGPLWPVAGFAQYWEGGPDIWNNPSDWNGTTYGEMPWYVPANLAVSGSQILVGANQSAEVTFAGRLARIILHSPFKTG